MSFYCHPKAICEAEYVGEGSRIAAFASVNASAVLGAGCTIGEGAVVRGSVRLGHSVDIGSGAQIGEGVILEDNVRVGTGASIEGVESLMEGNRGIQGAVVGKGSRVGSNATVLPGIQIGRGAQINPGTVVTRNVPDLAVVEGNPAVIVGYSGSSHTYHSTNLQTARESKSVTDSVEPESSRIIELTAANDIRGYLSAGETGRELPFEPKRFFVVFNVPSIEARGSHAHKECHQLLICVSGSVRALVHDGTTGREYVLNSPNHALYMPPMTWGTQFQYSKDAVLVVLASHQYDPDDYIRTFEDFSSLVRDSD